MIGKQCYRNARIPHGCALVSSPVCVCVCVFKPIRIVVLLVRPTLPEALRKLEPKNLDRTIMDYV